MASDMITDKTKIKLVNPCSNELQNKEHLSQFSANTLQEQKFKHSRCEEEGQKRDTLVCSIGKYFQIIQK
jgi:hypothetical protein